MKNLDHDLSLVNLSLKERLITLAVTRHPVTSVPGGNPLVPVFVGYVVGTIGGILTGLSLVMMAVNGG